jgi:hypothetical protein
MINQNVCFKLPPITRKIDGTPKRVGFELEFSGLSLGQTADALQAALGGRLEKKNRVEWTVHVEALGDFKIELDWHYLKCKAEENAEEAQYGKQPDLFTQTWVDLLAQASALLVPVEIACPPVAVTGLEVLLPMVASLRKAGAIGTEESLLAAYGVHINTEIYSLNSATLFPYLKAFALLQWWLVDAHQVDVSRKISPYIDLYPEAYLRKLLSQPQPSMAQIAADYLAYNPTRNRALDLLPMLACWNKEVVQKVVDDPRIQARPTFHYRLPNCRIDREDWSLAEAWNKWWVVEQLAHRPADLEKLGLDFLIAERPLIGISRRDWVEYMDQWLRDNGLV